VSDQLYKCYSSDNAYNNADNQFESGASKPAAGFDLRSWQGWQSCGLVVSAHIATTRQELTQSLDQRLYDFRAYDVVVAAHRAAQAKIKAQIASDATANAPKTDY
jgi:hypothetical protein